MRSDAERTKLWIIIFTVMAVTIGIFAYHAAFANYFTGDDFVYLIWIRDALANPFKFAASFWTSSLDSTVTLFYRPLVQLSMAMDYAIWGKNAVGFHVTNFILHSLCSIFFTLILQTLPFAFWNDKNSETMSMLKLWAVISGALFFLYPLHSEVVTWIGGRVDCQVSFFIFLSIYAYLRSRLSDSRNWYFVSATAFVLALCSKEMAVVIPPVFVLIELFFRKKLCAPSSLLPSLGKTKSAWLILAVYFVVRRIALGTFIGGYDNKLQVDSFSGLVTNWANSIAMMLIPLSSYFIDDKSWMLITTWCLGLAASFVALLISYLRSAHTRQVVNFLVLLSCIFCLPVYKVMSIAPALQSSRFAYLVSAPFCAMIALGVCSVIGTSRFRRPALVIFTGLLFALSGTMLELNNKAWKHAGTVSNYIQSTIEQIIASGQKNCILIGTPDTVDGAYVSRDALTVIYAPQIKATFLNNPTRTFPLGIWQTVTSMRVPKPVVMKWDLFSSKLLTCNSFQNSNSSEQNSEYLGHDLRTILSADDVLFNIGGRMLNSKAPVAIHFSAHHQQCDVVEITFDGAEGIEASDLAMGISENPTSIKVVHAQRINSSTATFEKYGNTHKKELTVVFPLRAEPAWILRNLPDTPTWLYTSRPTSGTISSIHFSSIDELAPKLTSDFSRIEWHTGEISMYPKEPSLAIKLDASKLKGATKVVLESIPAAQFDGGNSSYFEPSFEICSRFAGPSTIKVELTDFPTSGLYCLRGRALDASGHALGLASDHLLINVIK